MFLTVYGPYTIIYKLKYFYLTSSATASAVSIIEIPVSAALSKIELSRVLVSIFIFGSVITSILFVVAVDLFW